MIIIVWEAAILWQLIILAAIHKIKKSKRAVNFDIKKKGVGFADTLKRYSYVLSYILYYCGSSFFQR